MNWPFFTNPALLGGLAAVAVPILIHLLLRSRNTRMRFSTLLFFRQQDPRATQRRKLRNWLLLVIRTLLVVLLVLGFARPYLVGHDAAAAGQPRRHVILVLDRSASMAAADREGPRWARAGQAMRNLLSQLKSDDLASLISCGTRAETLAGPVPPEHVLTLLKDLQPTQSATELGQGLELASKLVTGAGSGFSNVIYVVSDLQRNSCRDLGSFPVPRAAEVKVLNFGDLLTANTAVTGLELEAQGTAAPAATLSNLSDEDTPPLIFQLLVDGKELKTAMVRLPAGGTTNVELALPRLSPGWHSGEARLKVKDALALDDARYRALYVPPPAQVLVAEPRPQAQLFREETFFVVSALDPTFGTTNHGLTSFQVEKTSLDAMAAKLALREGKPPYPVAILPGLKQIPTGLGSSLATFVRAGGGLLMFLGDGVNAIRYSSELGPVLPAQPAAVASAVDFDWRLWETSPRSPVFAPFRRPNSGNLMLAKFTRRAALSAYDENSVIARFQDGVPLMVVRELGQGKILLVNSSADTAWTDWPKHRTYVPWLHGVMGYLQAGGILSVTNLAPAWVAGAEADVDLGPALKNTPLKLQGPDGKEVTGKTDEAGVWRDCPLATAGVYAVRGVDGRELRRLAVNLPVSESDLAALSPAEFEQQLVRVDAAANRSLAASLFGGADGRHELWRLCLLAAMALLFLELTLANRTIA